MQTNKEEVKEYIKNWLKNISVQFPSIDLKYYYEKWDDTHYIFVNPIDEYLNGEFGKVATNFEINMFLKKYPDELLAFIPMSEYNPEIDKPILFEKPFELKISINESSYFASEVIFILFKKYELAREKEKKQIHLENINLNDNTIEDIKEYDEHEEYAA